MKSSIFSNILFQHKPMNTKCYIKQWQKLNTKEIKNAIHKWVMEMKSFKKMQRRTKVGGGKGREG